MHCRWLCDSARELQSQSLESGLSEADFFDKYGFILLQHRSAMSEDDWRESHRDVLGSGGEWQQALPGPGSSIPVGHAYAGPPEAVCTRGNSGSNERGVRTRKNSRIVLSRTSRVCPQKLS